MIPLAKNMKQPSRVHIGWEAKKSDVSISSGVHLKDGVLDDLDAIDDVANEEHEGDDHEGDEG